MSVTKRRSVKRIDRISKDSYGCYECGEETRNDLVSDVYVADSDRVTEMHAVVCDECVQLYMLETVV